VTQCTKWFKEKVFNLEECMNKEFLRPRKNRCKWFNELGVMRRRLFIERGDKTDFSHRHNRVNRFTKWVNRFRQQKTTHNCMKDETIQCMCESIQVSRRWRLIRVNLLMNRFNVSQRVWWDDSNWNESIQVWIDSGRYESIHQKSETLMSRFRSHKMAFDTFSQGHNRILTKDT